VLWFECSFPLRHMTKFNYHHMSPPSSCVGLVLLWKSEFGPLFPSTMEWCSRKVLPNADTSSFVFKTRSQYVPKLNLHFSGSNNPPDLPPK
jgi:hypothetical protein